MLFFFYYNYKYFIILKIFIIIFFSLFEKKCNLKNNISKGTQTELNNHNNLIDENFFVFDSNHLEDVLPHMFGFSVTKNGILTDNYYKNIGHYEIPEPQGVFVMVRKIGNEIIINQDFHGSFGIYIYESKYKDYFALSNSFLLLVEYLIGKKNISFNKDFADNLVISDLYSHSIYETLINEIIQLPSNSYLVINITKKLFQIFDINYKENTVPLYSEEGLKIIDDWIDKWGYIFRSLKNKTEIISCDLSGGFDTRIVLSILLNTGIDLNNILIRSSNNSKHVHKEDFKIATNISSKYGFKLNNKIFDNKGTKWSSVDTLLCSLYLKLGFHKEFYLKTKFFTKPKFAFTGNGGEDLRGSPGFPIKTFIDKICSKNVFGSKKEFTDSSKRIFNRSILFLKRKKSYNNDYEIAYDLYSIIVGRNHFGRSAVEAFMANIYSLQPLMDPDIKKINYNISESSQHDLLAYIYIRFANELIHFPIQGNRRINLESIKRAEKLNAKLMPYKIKSDYNINFYIDINRTSPSPISVNKNDKNVYNILQEIFNSFKYKKIINKLYGKNVYNWAKEYSKKSNYHPFRHEYALFAIALIKQFISLNQEYLFKSNFIYNYSVIVTILNYLVSKNMII